MPLMSTRRLTCFRWTDSHIWMTHALAHNLQGRHLGGLDFHYCEPTYKYPLLGLTRHDLQTLLMEGAEPGESTRRPKWPEEI